MPTKACQRNITAASWSSRLRSSVIEFAILRAFIIPTSPNRSGGIPRYPSMYLSTFGQRTSSTRRAPWLTRMPAARDGNSAERGRSLPQLAFDDPYVHERLREAACSRRFDGGPEQDIAHVGQAAAQHDRFRIERVDHAGEPDTK